MTDPKQYIIPTYLLGQLEDWIQPTRERVPIDSGSFLYAVLINNLGLAVMRADKSRLRYLPALVLWLYTNAPDACWGSPDNVKAWRFMKEKP